MATTATVGRTTTLAFTEIDNLEPHTKRSGSIPLFHDTCPSSGRTIRADPQWSQIESPTAYGVETEEAQGQGRLAGSSLNPYSSSTMGEHMSMLRLRVSTAILW